MRTLNENELDQVSGAFPFLVLPLIVIMVPAPEEILSSAKPH